MNRSDVLYLLVFGSLFSAIAFGVWIGRAWSSEHYQRKGARDEWEKLRHATLDFIADQAERDERRFNNLICPRCKVSYSVANIGLEDQP